MKSIIVATMLLMCGSPVHSGPDADLYQRALDMGAIEKCFHIEESPLNGFSPTSYSGNHGNEEFEGDYTETFIGPAGNSLVARYSFGEQVCIVNVRLRAGNML